MKKLLYFFGIFAAIVFIASFLMTRVPVLTTEGKAVLMMFGREQYEEAYAFFSKDFQERYPFPIFKQSVEQIGLSNYKEVKWASNVMAPDKQRGQITGTVLTRKNQAMYIEMDFIRNNNAKNLSQVPWVIDNMRVNPH